VPALNELATGAYDASSTYADHVHIVSLYVIEPHPMAPDVGPYSGAVSEREYSTKDQPRTYSKRVDYAQETELFLEGEQIMLVDELLPEPLNNPAWCTYGPCPNCAYLIRQNGVIDTVQRWVNVAEMKAAIDELLR
jgi:hypothetical protein